MLFGYLFRFFFFMEICQHDTQDKTTHTSKMISVILLPIKQSRLFTVFVLSQQLLGFMGLTGK